ncbi:hypothetical protein V5279_25180 [Bradyrhizobium sp. 26S5]|uniref:hypothetical protein n=1 Tax=Bradyrhizobium sp. 26S5 TaxID=3139729 RepID=UPI0030CEBE49
MTLLALATPELPGAYFANRNAWREFSASRSAYEAAVTAYETETEPAAIRVKVAAARRRGFNMVTAESVRDGAALVFQDKLRALGFTEADVLWHTDCRGRRMTEKFVTLRRSLGPERGVWRGYYNR